MPPKINLIGHKYGKLSVIEEADRSPDNKVRWLCLCDCGNVVKVRSNSLRTKETKSCGCYAIEVWTKQARSIQLTHDKSSTRVYTIWNNMKQRCFNKENPSYKNYGGRGISMEPEFVKDFVEFYNAVGKPPDETSNWSIDRIDNNLGYISGNMRWATTSQQNRNKNIHPNNKSGITGVNFKLNKSGRTYWVAQWNDLNMKRKSKAFSIDKLGSDKAFTEAVSYREQMIEYLNLLGADYTKDHGKVAN